MEITVEGEDPIIPIENLIIMQITIKDISIMETKEMKEGAQDRLTKDVRINVTMVTEQEPPHQHIINRNHSKIITTKEEAPY